MNKEYSDWDSINVLSGDIPDGFKAKLVLFNFPQGHEEYTHKKGKYKTSYRIYYCKLLEVSSELDVEVGKVFKIYLPVSSIYRAWTSKSRRLDINSNKNIMMVLSKENQKKYVISEEKEYLEE